MVAAIAAARRGLRTLICEHSPSLGIKLLATGGRRCNLTNTLSTEEFMERVKPHGRFMGPALDLLGGTRLRDFFTELGMETVVLDGFRVWPATRKSSSVLAALMGELERLGVDMAVNCRVLDTRRDEEGFIVEHSGGSFRGKRLVLATGGLALPKSGAIGEGYTFAERFGHKCAPRHPAGVPFRTAEQWPARLTAHTIGKARLKVGLKKYARFSAVGALIFTRAGLRGPVVLDLSRDISPLLEKSEVVPLELNLCDGKTAEDWQQIFKAWRHVSDAPLAERLAEHMPLDLAHVFCDLAEVDGQQGVHRIKGQPRDSLIALMVKTPLTVTGTTGYDGAFITRGGVRLKEVRPDTLESKRQPGLFFCGEVLDIDGPCGGFNLQWAFASGYLAGGGH